MAQSELIEQLLRLNDNAAQRDYLQEQRSRLTDAVVKELKDRAIQLRLQDAQGALALSALIAYAAELTGCATHEGYALWAEAVIRSLELAEFQVALTKYDRAIAIFRRANDEVSQAIIQISRLWSLESLGRHEEAFAAATWAGQILEANAMWLQLGTLTMNVGLIHNRLGNDQKALEHFEQTLTLYQRAGAQYEVWWAQAEHNRSLALRNLGRFEESLAACRNSLAIHQKLGNSTEVARAQQNLGVTHLVQGKYNDALQLLEAARHTFLTNQLQRNAIRAELYITDCLLRLRRFDSALKKCQQLRESFHLLETPLEAAQSLLNEGIALAGLQAYTESLETLTEARDLFQVEQAVLWSAFADLEIAAVYFCMGHYEQSFDVAVHCQALMAQQSQPIYQAEAYLKAAQAALALKQHTAASDLVNCGLEICEQYGLPSLAYQAHYLRSLIAKANGELAQTIAELTRSIAYLEQIRGWIMVEHRIDFQEDKQRIYEDMIALHLQMGAIDQAFDHAEKAKSRALLELLAYKIDLRVRVYHEADRPYVEQLNRLREERDKLYRRWFSSRRSPELSQATPHDEEPGHALVQLENQITDLWHTLLVRNAHYEQDTALWQISVAPIAPYLDEATLLLEFFVVQEQLLVFCVSRDAIHVEYLSAKPQQLQSLIQRFYQHLHTLARLPAAAHAKMTGQANYFLQTLYTQLLLPIAPKLEPFEKLVIVPHGSLHYLPFHALYDGESYLLERYEISYLPNASTMHYCHNQRATASGALAVGVSSQGQLPHTLSEAEAVAAVLGGDLLLEACAVRDQVIADATDKAILHLATHGEMRESQPLFSGLALADGWLTTLDIFNLELNASLVTLSACQTGYSKVGGGDELLGLMRAFIYAGASSLLLSLWSVEDSSTAALMRVFYQQLVNGASKSAAIQSAQRHLLHATQYQHPYFWAPFFLVGNPSPIRA